MTPPLTDEELEAWLRRIGDYNGPMTSSGDALRLLLGELQELRRHMALHYPARGSQLGDLTAEEEYMLDVCEEAIKWRPHQYEQAPLCEAIDALIAFCANGGHQPLRHHRSRLSAEDVEALRWLAFMLGKHGHEPYAYESEECDCALAVLERLCGAKEGA